MDSVSIWGRIKALFQKQNNSINNAQEPSQSRRSALTRLVAGSGAVALGASTAAAQAHQKEGGSDRGERFPGDPPEHKMLYQLNKDDTEYHKHVVNSAGAMIGKYADNIDIVIACFGRGIHVLVKNPARPVDDEVREKIKSLAEQGVKFHACGRTLTAMNWTKDDLLPFAKLVDVGVADMMELQEQNYAYVAW